MINEDFHPYLYVIGGRVRGNTVTVAERLSLKNLEWSSISPLHEARGNLGCVAMKNSLLAIGGNGLKSNLSTCELYDVTKDEWRSSGELNVARHALSSCEYNNEIYTCGGWEYGTKSTILLEVLNKETNKWDNLATLVTPRRLHGFAGADNKLFVFGGGSDTAWVMDSVECYDIVSNTWSVRSSLPHAGFSSAITIDEVIYVVVWGDCIYRYNHLEDNYTSLGPLPLPEWNGFCIASYKENIFVLGGKTKGQWTTKVYTYNTTTNIWSSEIPRMGSSRRRCAATVVIHQNINEIKSSIPNPRTLYGIEKSAFTVSIYRAQEAKQKDALFVDTFSEYLIKEYLNELDLMRVFKHPFYHTGVKIHALRTSLIDRYIVACLYPHDKEKQLAYIKDGEKISFTQIVLLASGMDSRSIRLHDSSLSHVTVFEVDVKDVIHFKQGNIGSMRETFHIPSLTTKYVISDVTCESTLTQGLKENGFDPSLPTIWVAEGLIEYLKVDAFSSLLNNICTLSSSNSRLVIPLLYPSILSISTSKNNHAFLPWSLPLLEKDEVNKMLLDHRFNSIKYVHADEYMREELYKDREMTDPLFYMVYAEIKK